MITMHAIIMDGGPHQFFSSNFCFRLKEAKSQASQAASGSFLELDSQIHSAPLL